MGWVGVLSLLALAGILFCVGVCLYAAWWDRYLRGQRRLSNGKIRREQITISMPTSWLKDFDRRTYGKTDPK
jgi:hypothetical protein